VDDWPLLKALAQEAAISRSVIKIAIALLAAVLSSAALGRGGGGHGGGGGGHGGGGHGGGHFAGHSGGRFGGHHFGGGHFGAHHFGGGHGFAHAHFGGGFAHHGHPNFGQMRNAAVRSGAMRKAMASLSHGRGLHDARVLGNPDARAHMAASMALAGWHGGVANGWWRHGNGWYGWVGPLFWPFAYYDIYDYTLWGDGIGFWGYGYPDIYAGLFGPYGYGELSGYLDPHRMGRRHRSVASPAQLCADDGRDIAGLPIEEIAQAVEPTEAQRTALDELAGASIKAAQTIRAACPTQAAATAPARLAAMQQRIEAMVAAVELVRPPLERLYGMLDDEQKARFNALAEDQRKRSGDTGSLAQGCGAAQPTGFTWPANEIEARVHPNDTQRAALDVLQDTAARAAEALKVACQPSEAVTPPARLEAAAKRLDTMRDQVKSVRAALEDFYATLSDEQKAQFEAIGPRRTS
jgi:LTXXQ motif family protein